jgi:hypothetical protein
MALPPTQHLRWRQSHDIEIFLRQTEFLERDHQGNVIGRSQAAGHPDLFAFEILRGFEFRICDERIGNPVGGNPDKAIATAMVLDMRCKMARRNISFLVRLVRGTFRGF